VPLQRAPERGPDTIGKALTQATGTAEREAAIAMVEDVAGTQRIRLGADKAYDTVDRQELQAIPVIFQPVQRSNMG
jgi:hypothetical protein